MADVRGASGVPLAGAFAGITTPTPSTPIYIDTDSGDIYALIGGSVKKLAASSVATALTAAGTNQGTALSVTAGVNVFGTVAAGTGAVLNANQTFGVPQVLYNGGANQLTVYPPSGGKINNLATNGSIFLAINTAISFWRATTTQWIGALSA